MKPYKFTVVLLLFSLCIFGQKTKTIDDSLFTANYPDRWTLGPPNAYLKFLVFSPEDNTVFAENVNLLVQDLNDGNMDLDGYAAFSIKQIKKAFQEVKITESQKVQGDAGEYYRIVYDALQGGYHLKWKQYYFVKNNRAWVLTFTSENDSYDRLVKDADVILDSFRLK